MEQGNIPLTPDALAALQREHITRIARAPGGAIVSFRTRVSEGAYDPHLLALLARAPSQPSPETGTSPWPALRDAGLAELLLDLLTRRIQPPSYMLPPKRVEHLKSLAIESSSSSGDEEPAYVSPWWYEPLHGLLNILSAMQSSQSGFRDPLNKGVLKLMATDAPHAVELIWAKDERGEYDGLRNLAVLDTNRAVLMRWLRAIWAVTEEVLGAHTLQRLKDAHAIELATTCWLHTTNPALFLSSSQCLLELITPVFVSADQPPSRTPNALDLDVVLQAAAVSSLPESGNSKLEAQPEEPLGPTTPEEVLTTRLLTTLLHPSVPSPESNTESILALANALGAQTSRLQIGLAFARGRIQIAVLAVLRRQLRMPLDGKDGKERKATSAIVNLGGNVILATLESVQYPLQTHLLTQMVQEHAFVSFLGTLFLRLAREDYVSPTLPPLLNLLQHTYACTNPTCTSRSTPQHRAALQKSLRAGARWYRVLLALRMLAPQSSSTALATTKLTASASNRATDARSVYERAWHAFGLAAEISEPSEARALDSAPSATASVSSTCNYLECLSETCEKATRTCSACKRVKYCTEGCQKRDWKDHKKECKRVI